MLLLVAGPSPVLAQETAPSVSDVANGQPITSNAGASSSSSTSSGTTPAPSSSPAPAPAVDLNPLDHIKPDQLLDLFSGMLTGLFGNLLTAARDSLIQFINDTDLLRQTPPTWVQNNQGATTLEAAMRQVANASLALIVFWLGLTIATRPWVGSHGLGLNPLEDLPRLLFAALLANSAQVWMPQAITLANSLSLWVWNVSVGDTNTLIDLLQRFARPDQTLLLIALGVLFLLVCLWVYFKHAARVALLIVLFVVAPLAMVCWVLPQTQHVFRAWHQLFWSRLGAQLVSCIALKLALSFAITAGDSPVAALITLGLLLVAAQAPELLGLTSGGMGLGSLLQTVVLTRAMLATPATAAAATVVSTATRSTGSPVTTGVAGTTAIAPRPTAVSGAYSGSARGTAATSKNTGRGGRRPATDKGTGSTGGEKA
ncbi:MAG: hypothetical protein JO023_20310 [Chloroflexi bacterium]|nr:hypothetical protein [Chloroflexota bacterium]